MRNILKSKKFIIVVLVIIAILVIVVILLLKFLNPNQLESKDNITMSYPTVSYPISYTNSGNIKPNLVWPDWYKSPNFPQLTQQELQAQSPVQSNDASNIRSYYSNLSSKNFVEAQKFGPLGRSIQEYQTLYNNVEKVILSQLKNMGGKNFTAKVFLFYKNTDLEKYRVNINLSDDGSYIAGSTANIVEDSTYYIECDLTAFVESENLCLIRDDADGEANYILTYGITETPYLLKGNLSSENTIYLVTKAGEFSDISMVMEYNFLTRKFKYIDTLTFTYPGPFGLYDYNLCVNQTNNPEDFTRGCLYDNYKDTDWFQENVRYLKNIKKYLPNPILYLN